MVDREELEWETRIRSTPWPTRRMLFDEDGAKLEPSLRTVHPSEILPPGLADEGALNPNGTRLGRPTAPAVKLRWAEYWPCWVGLTLLLKDCTCQ